jgi:hypothetical protein
MDPVILLLMIFFLRTARTREERMKAVLIVSLLFMHQESQGRAGSMFREFFRAGDGAHEFLRLILCQELQSEIQSEVSADSEEEKREERNDSLSGTEMDDTIRPPRRRRLTYGPPAV